MTFIRKIIIASLVVIAIAAFFLFTLNGGEHVEASEGDGAPPPQAMPVSLEAITPKPVQLWKNFSGHVVAVDRAEIRPQVSGRITEILFEDGQHVEEGDLLIVIDPKPYEATLNQAKAALEAAMTEASLAEKEYQRAKKLIETDAIAKSVLDERINRRRVAAAAVQGAQATVERAEVDLDYAYVKAPISGKISRAEITIGNLVQDGAGAPLLTTIVAEDKVYVDFEVDERTYIGNIRSRSQTGKPLAAIPVRVKLQEDMEEYKGTIHSFDNRIDPASGTIRARAVFDNEDQILLPGMSVSVLMGSNGDQEQILISERAIGTDQDRKFVYTVNGDSIAKYREVKIGQSIDGQRVILSGLEAGEKIITDGIVRIRPGMPVMDKSKMKPQEAAENDIGAPPEENTH